MMLLSPMIPCLSSLNCENRHFIVLFASVEGGELFDRIVDSGYLSERDTRFLFLQMLMATKVSLPINAN